MDVMDEHEYVRYQSLFIVEMERGDVINLVHAAHMHAEKLSAPESKELVDAANRLSDQVVYYQNGTG